MEEPQDIKKLKTKFNHATSRWETAFKEDGFRRTKRERFLSKVAYQAYCELKLAEESMIMLKSTD